MKKSLVLTTSIFAFALLSCKKESTTSNQPTPVASFTHTFVGDNSHAPCTVQFKSTSTNSSSESWDFGDGSSAVGTNVSHKYTAEGSYVVKLTSSNGQTSTKTETITVSRVYSSVAIAGFWVNAPLSTTSDIGFIIWDNIGGVGTPIWSSPVLPVPPNYPNVFTPTIPALLSSLSTTYLVKLMDINGSTLQLTPFIPTLYNTGNTTIDSYPTHVDCSNNFSFDLEWN